MKLVGGSCAAGAALSSCQSSLFASAGGGGASASSSSAGASVSARLLVVMMAGKSTDSITSSASIKESGVKILCLGLGGSYDKEQMTTMASSAEYFLSVSTFSGLSGISQQFIGLISQGKTVVFNVVLLWAVTCTL